MKIHAKNRSFFLTGLHFGFREAVRLEILYRQRTYPERR